MAVIVPSRGRPQNIERLLKAFKDTEAKVDLWVGFDRDDEKSEEYMDLLEATNSGWFRSQERKRFGPTLNDIAVEIQDAYKYIAWMGDDHLPRTKGWDQEYRNELDKLGYGIVYGNDLVQGENIPTQMAMTSDIIGALGYAVPQGFVHLFIDNYFLELGRALGKITYLPDVVVEHLHPCVGNAQEDKTYKEANSPENWSNDQKRFHEYMENELAIDVERIREKLNDIGTR